jgi:hypothetical protein
MKIIYSLLIVSILGSFGCKKAIEEKIEQKQTDILVGIMTDGEWNMTSFKENGVTDSNLVGYTFKYYSDYTVDGKSPSGYVKRGNWTGNAVTQTTTCEFPADALPTLLKINGSWKITRNSLIYVEAQQIVGNLTKTMRLDKK